VAYTKRELMNIYTENIQKIKADVLRWRRFISRREILLAIFVTVVVIIVGVGLGWENNKVVPVNADPAARYTQEIHNHLSFMANWDGPDYINLAQHGYTQVVQTSFFPVYPLAIRLVNQVVSSPLVSSLIVSWLCLVGAIYYYLKIIKKLYGVRDNLEALRGALFFILFPTGVFLIATYTESLFAFLALASIYYALRKRYLMAAPFLLLATATRVNGLFVLALVVLLLWEQKEKLRNILATLVIGSMGMLSYMVYLANRFHNPIAFVTAQKDHGWLKYGYADFATELVSINGLFLLAIAVSVLYWWPRRKSFAIYSLLYVAIALLGGLGGFGRYALMAFPLQFMLYELQRPKRLGYPLVIALFGIGWVFFMLRYAGGYSGG